MNTAIIVAAGSGTRFGGEMPKQFLEINGKPLLIHSLERFENCAAIDGIILVLSSDQLENFSEIAKKYSLKKLAKIVSGGRTRAESVFNGLQAIEKDSAEIVAVHDGARPLVTSEEISATIEKTKETGAACLVAPVTDTIKEVAGGKIVGTIERAKLRRALTPQAFHYEILQKAFANADLEESITDECFLVEKLGYEIAVVEGSAKNIKITTREDFSVAEIFLKQIANRKSKMFRIGFGNDIHRLETGKPLILGGVLIKSGKGAVGHSDADCLTHAVTDAILGALAVGDIGSHFSDKDERWRAADSFVFLRYTVGLMKEKGFRVGNVDSTINLEKPRLQPFIDEMRKNLALALEVEIDCISVKAKTGEMMDAVGKEEAVKAEAIVLLVRN